MHVFFRVNHFFAIETPVSNVTASFLLQKCLHFTSNAIIKRLQKIKHHMISEL